MNAVHLYLRLHLRGGQKTLVFVQTLATEELAKERAEFERRKFSSVINTARVAQMREAPLHGKTAVQAQDLGPLMGFLADMGIENFDMVRLPVEVKSSNIEVVPGSVILK